MGKIARKLPADCPRIARSKSSSVRVKGVDYPLHLDRGAWRVRKRSTLHSVEFSTGTVNLAEAQKEARRVIEGELAERQRIRSGGSTLKKIFDHYEKTMALGCRDYVARKNVVVATRVFRVALRKKPDRIYENELTSDVWMEFARISQGGRLQYAVPVKKNTSINSDVRVTLSIFSKGLEREYEKLGYRINFTELRRFKWLKELNTPKQPEPVKLPAAIRALRDTEPLKWRAIGLARFAGLRQKELRHARRHWIELDAHGNTCVRIMHRPKEGFLAKSDKPGLSIILDAQLAADLLALTPGSYLAPPPDYCTPRQWADELNAWVRPFVPVGKKAMHRLRGFYGDEIAKVYEDAAAARLAGIRAAQSNLRHESSATTVEHYLTGAQTSSIAINHVGFHR